MARFIFYALTYLHVLFAMQVVEGLKDAADMVDQMGKEQGVLHADGSAGCTISLHGPTENPATDQTIRRLMGDLP